MLESNYAGIFLNLQNLKFILTVLTSYNIEQIKTRHDNFQFNDMRVKNTMLQIAFLIKSMPIN